VLRSENRQSLKSRRDPRHLFEGGYMEEGKRVWGEEIQRNCRV
jgi:hypothetical protein